MKIEHGFRDIKSCFGFGDLVLKKGAKSRISVLWFLAVITYGLLFMLHQKSGYRWLKELCKGQKAYSLIRVIKRVVSEAWDKLYLCSVLEALLRRVELSESIIIKVSHRYRV